MSNKVFTEGMWFNPPSERAPDFVVGNISFDTRQFIPWLEQNGGSTGKIRVALLRSKKDRSKIYGVLDTWEPEKRQEGDAGSDKHKDAPPQDNGSDTDDVPF